MMPGGPAQVPAEVRAALDGFEKEVAEER